MAPMPGRMRYFGHDATAMSATEAARIAAMLPLPKKRGAVAPKGFTRRYGNTHRRADRRGRARRARCLRLCRARPRPEDKAPPVSKVKRPIPGDEYETATPPPAPVEASTRLPVEQPLATEQ